MRYAGVDRVTHHAGAGVLRRINGAEATPITKHSGGYYRHLGNYNTSYNSVGIETCNFGYARRSRQTGKTTVAAKADWPYIIPKHGRTVTNWRNKGKGVPSSRKWWRIEPWPPEQIALCIYLGKHIVSELPHITMRNHHGHHDTCPIRKIDIIGFPFARVLRSVYPDEIVPDVWSHFLVSVNRGNDRRTTTHPRQLALLQFNYEMGNSTDNDRPKAERLGENTQIAGFNSNRIV